MMMRVLVTGAGGFIGRHVVRVLGEQGHDIFVMTRSKASMKVPGWNCSQLRFVEVDLSDGGRVQSAVCEIRPEWAIHLAWCAVPGQYRMAPENLDCAAATLKLVRVLAKAECKRLVIAGSCAEYDWNYGFLSENCTPLEPRTLYGTCKNAVRQMVESFCRGTSMQLAWTRLFHLFGPHEPSSRMVPSLIISLLRGGIARCTGGEQIRDFLHVQDVAAAISAVAKSDFTGSVNIGSGEPVRIRTIAESLARIIGCSDRLEFGTVKRDPCEPPFLVADVRTLNQEIGWTPALTLDAGLMQTVDWWKANL